MSSTVFGRFHRLSETLDGGNDVSENSEEAIYEPHVMCEEEIMHKYWKIAVSSQSIIPCFNHVFQAKYFYVIKDIVINSLS